MLCHGEINSWKMWDAKLVSCFALKSTNQLQLGHEGLTDNIPPTVASNTTPYPKQNETNKRWGKLKKMDESPKSRWLVDEPKFSWLSSWIPSWHRCWESMKNGECGKWQVEMVNFQQETECSGKLDNVNWLSGSLSIDRSFCEVLNGLKRSYKKQQTELLCH